MTPSKLPFALPFAALLLVCIACSKKTSPLRGDDEECVRAVRCVEGCGGRQVQIGCLACPKGTIDDIDCPRDAGAADASATRD